MGNIATSLGQLGKALGVTRQAVKKWTVRGDWPFSKEPPWDVDNVAEWRRANLNRALDRTTHRLDQILDGSEDKLEDALKTITSLKTREEVRKTIAQRQRIEHDLMVLRNEVLPVRVVRDEWSSLVSTARSELLMMGRSLSSALVGLTSAEIESAIHDRILEILEQLANGPSHNHD